MRRRRLRLQRPELAARLGCAVVKLRKIEPDARRPSRRIAERLAVALGTPEPQHELFIKIARGEIRVDHLEEPGSPTDALSGFPSDTGDHRA